MKNHRFLSEEREASLEVDRLLGVAEVKAEAKVLDFGCGPGLFMDYYMANSVMDVVGYDIDVKAIEYCRSEYPMYLFTTDMPDDKYDNIIMSNVLHHLEDKATVVASLVNRLEKNGILTIVEFKKQEIPNFGPSIDHKLAIEEAKEELRSFNLLEEVDFNEYYYILKYKR